MRDELSAEEMRAWAPRAEATPPPVDLRLPGYSGFQLVAQGGEGAVYRARQDGLGRDVAIKALQVVDPASQARFRRELDITVRLGRQHPHVVTVLDTGTLPDGRPCIVMEFYDLGSLHDRLRALGPLPVAEVVAAGVAVADALAFAHAQGFLHRDVKPQNVLVLPTSYVLADFGIARGADAGHSASLQMVSYRHAAPQMIAGEAPAAADDLWSLGSTLFTLLTGHPPFAGENPDEDTVLSYLDRVRAADPRPLTRPDVPAALTDIITRCLSKRREDRFPDAAALRDALTGVSVDLRRWQPPVDPDATSIAPGAPAPAEDVTSLSVDFGPRPTPAPAPAQVPEPQKPLPAPEARGTMTGRLADLTQRHSDPPPVDFGPGTADPALPPPAPPPTWSPHPDPPTAVTPASSTANPASPARPPEPEPPTAATPTSSPTDPAPPTATTSAGSPAPTPPAPGSTHPEPPSSPTDPTGPTPAITSANSPAEPALPPTHEPPTAVRDGHLGHGLAAGRGLGVGAAGTGEQQAVASASGPAAPALPADPASSPRPEHLTTASPPATRQNRPDFPPPPKQERKPSPSTPFPARDTPTVPKLTPSAIEGFPAMPKAHEWEYDTAPRPSAEPRTKRWRGFAIAGIVAAVVGVGIGVLASREVATTPPAASTTPVTSSVSIPPGGDPAVAPVLTDVDDRGDEVELTWRDPTRGQAQFVLYDVTEAGDVPRPITGIAAGLTGFVVTGLDPAAEYCFQLVAIGLTDPSTQRGASDRVCVER